MELRNPLSKAQLATIRPRPLVVEFTDGDFPGPILMGKIPAGYIAKETEVSVVENFDGGVGITVGDMVAQARLQAVSDNHPSRVDNYHTFNSFEYDTETDIYVFFPTGTPTQGRARVIVYLS